MSMRDRCVWALLLVLAVIPHLPTFAVDQAPRPLQAPPIIGDCPPSCDCSGQCGPNCRCEVKSREYVSNETKNHVSTEEPKKYNTNYHPDSQWRPWLPYVKQTTQYPVQQVIQQQPIYQSNVPQYYQQTGLQYPMQQSPYQQPMYQMSAQSSGSCGAGGCGTSGGGGGRGFRGRR